MKRLLFIIILQTSRYQASDSRYECGPHGRFEYCVDDIPGCVIGCHCHPGYYFDTETKICEPNTNLIQNYRRKYAPEPSRVQIPTHMETVLTETTHTTRSPVDAKIDEITKDADDLGDWLYNQFFKTVENQVINKTNDDKQLTRRSGKTNSENKSEKKTKKLWKRSRRRRKKSKKRNLKKKLLRVTEDDSLFDSSSTDTSDDSSDSSSSSSSSNSASESETDTRVDKHHGHKKLVILSKKPRPQLPSFIFLPNIDTPFYPPIGLPPPPPVPMYPIIPVPPIGPYAIVTTTKHDDKVESSTSANTSTPSEASASLITTTAASPTVEETSEDATVPHRLRVRSKKMKKKMKNESRNKLMQKLRQRVNAGTNPADYLMDYQDGPHFINIGIPKEQASPTQIPANAIDDEPPKDEVDFKYLSQLIHKPDIKINISPLSQSMNTNPSVEKPKDNKYLPAQTNTPMNPRRQLNTMNKPEDMFYANLGRQIASMIRKMDSEGQRHIDIEIEKSNDKPANLPLFFENTYSPRSYWERSVRSPMKKIIGELEYIKKSNENLFSLENKVENEATKRFLTLPELENLISTIAKYRKLGVHNLSTNKSLNFKLLPHHRYDDIDTGKTNMSLNKNISMNNFKFAQNSNNLPFRRFPNNNDELLTKSVQGISVTGKTRPINYKPITVDKTLDKLKGKNNFNMVKNNNKNPLFPSNKSVLTHTNKLDKLAPAIKPTLIRKLKYNWNPTAERLNFHYYFGDNNQYDYEKTFYPLLLPNTRKYKYVDTATPSYFHHELHHLDFFE